MAETQTSTTAFSECFLSFFKDLNVSSVDEIETIWANKKFPLVDLDDFTQNWLEVRDDAGIFQGETGLLYRVEPRDHHIPRIRAILDDCESSSNVYEAIIFAKIMHELFVNGLRSIAVPDELRRRLLVLHFQRLPRKWSHISIRHDLHLYKERVDPTTLPLGASVYSALAVSNHIRVLTLLPATDQASNIHCTMEEVELHPELKYEALSYTWGAPTPRKTITLNEKSFSVTANLAAALRCLRLARSTRVIWIDAICINQGDVQERNSQVSQMNLIYQNANRVVVWLGKETNTSARLFDGLEIYREWTRSGLSWDLSDSTSLLHELYGIEVREDVRLPTMPTTTFQRIECLIKFMERPWWKRVWILQEFILAREAILVCGSRSIEWKYFQAALNSIAPHCRRAPFPHTTDRSATANILRASLIEKIYDTLPFSLLQQGSDYSKSNILPTLPELLSLSRDSNATDDRDRIFALIGLMKEEEQQRLNIAPCYEMSTRQVFVSVAKSFIETTHKLDVLFARPNDPRWFYVYGTKSGPYHEDILLPSWVPNWTQPWTMFTTFDIAATEFSWYRTLQRFMANEARQQNQDSPPTSAEDAARDLYKAGLHYDDQHLHTRWRFTDNDEILHVRGILVDTIVSVGVLMQSSFADLRHGGERGITSEGRKHWTAVLDWKRLLNGLNAGSGTYAPTGGSIVDAFWRTVLLDRALKRQENPYSLGRLPEIIDQENCKTVFGWSFDWVFPPKDDRQEKGMIDYLMFMTVKTAFNRLNIYCAQLRFFVTSQGYIGVGHPNCKPGDDIVVLLGSSVPLILHEYDKEHVLVGESYVHGIMDGELLRDGKGGWRNQDDFQWFSLV